MLTLPLGNSFLYVEPIYVESNTASASNFPTLQRVLVTYGDNIGYGATLSDALTDIQTGRATGSSVDTGQTGGSTTDPTAGSSTTPSSRPSATPSATPSTSGSTGTATPAPNVAAVRAQLNKAYAALAGLSATDPKAAAAQQKVNQLVKQLIDLGGLPTAAPTAGASPSK